MALVLPCFLVLTLTAVLVSAQHIRLGTCPYQKAQPFFNYLAYNGLWYEQLRYENAYQIGHSCDSRFYLGIGGVMAVSHNRFKDSTGGVSLIPGRMVNSAAITEGKFTVRYPFLWDVPLKYWILETDYVSYSINWACSDIPGLVNKQYLWAYTREKNPPAWLIIRMRGIIAFKGLSTGPLVPIRQNCII